MLQNVYKQPSSLQSHMAGRVFTPADPDLFNGFTTGKKIKSGEGKICLQVRATAKAVIHQGQL
jgi:hypothetical protein